MKSPAALHVFRRDEHAANRMTVMKVLVALFLLSVSAYADSTLNNQIREVAATAQGRVGVACSLPGSRLDCNFNQNARMPMQSVYKLPIAMAMLSAIERGKVTLETEVRVLPSDLISTDQHSPLQDAHPQANIDVSIRELLRLAVAESDGVASDVVLRALGGASVVNAYVRSLGIRGIQIQDTEKTLGRDVNAQYRNYAEPSAMVALLRLLADRSPLSPEHTALLLRWMTETETGAKRLKGLLPAGTVLAHKTGTSGQTAGITQATNDVGLITLPDGRQLALAVFVSDSPADQATREAVIAKICHAIWEAAVAHK